MSALQTRSKDAIVGLIAAGMQGRVSRFLNFAVGSVFLALAEAHTAVALWLQAEILKVLRRTRAATSEDSELDSWMADFGVSRLPARPSTGLVVFGRFTAGSTNPTIPVGALVQTQDGSQQFAVYEDDGNINYSAAANGYVFSPGAGTMIVPVQAVTPGTKGNVDVGLVSLISSNVSGVDYVGNPAALTSGEDAESDESFRSRFPDFIASLSKATEQAIRSAIRNLELGLKVQILDCQALDGTTEMGLVTVIVDDGSGATPEDVIAQARKAANLIKAAGVQVSVHGAQTLLANVGMFIDVADGYTRDVVVGQVGTALSQYINGLSLGEKLSYSRLPKVAYDASAGVTGVSNVTLNGSTRDMIPAPGFVVRAGNMAVG